MSKLTSARFWMAIMFSATTCAGYLLNLMPTEAFTALAGMIVAHYFSKTRVNENPLKPRL